MRSLTQGEQAFLAWAFIELMIKRNALERGDSTVAGLIEEWQDQTGEEMKSDFVEFCQGIHSCQ